MTTSPGVTVGNAAKVACDIVNGAASLGLPIGEYIGHYAEALDTVLQLMEERTESANVSPTVQRVENAFPGSTVQSAASTPAFVPAGAPAPVAAAPTNVVPFQQPASAAPAPIPGAAPSGDDPELDAAWRQFFTDVDQGNAGQWEDNRQKKAQGGKFDKIPDFSHKTWKRPGSNYTVGLYINDKKRPGWVGEQLAAHGIQAS